MQQQNTKKRKPNTDNANDSIKLTTSAKKQHNKMNVEHNNSNNIIQHMKGFNVMRIPIPMDSNIVIQSNNNNNNQQQHYGYLYYKPETNNNIDNALFVINIPYYYTEQQLYNIFSQFGKIENVEFIYNTLQPIHKINIYSHASCKRFANIVYSNNDAVHNAMLYDYSTDNSMQYEWTIDTTSDIQSIGIDKYINQYHSIRPNIDTLETQINQLMSVFDQQQSLLKQGNNNNDIDQPIVDEDGFTLVRYNKTNLLQPKLKKMDTYKPNKNLTGEAKRKQQRKNKQVIFLYKHQRKQKQNQQIDMLRKQFQSDQLKLKKLKQKNMLKPTNNVS